MLNLFAGAATLGIIAIWGISRRRARTPRAALVAGVAVWTLTWIGVFIDQAKFPNEVGYWVLLANLGVAIIGTVVVLVSARADAREPTTGLPRWRSRTQPHANSLHLHHQEWGSNRHHPMYVLEK